MTTAIFLSIFSNFSNTPASESDLGLGLLLIRSTASSTFFAEILQDKIYLNDIFTYEKYANMYL